MDKIVIFENSGILNFWMKNTIIPLDMLFINQDGVIETIERDVPPCITSSCPLYNSKKAVRYVLEINGGVADVENIREGDKVSW